MFASIDLCRRIETAEANLTAAMAEHARAAGTGDAVLCERSAGGVAAYVRPDAPMNKWIGAGFDGRIDDAALAAIEHAFASRRAPLHVELATLAPIEVAQQFATRGYRLVAFENVLGHDPRKFVSPGSPHRVEVADEAGLDAWIDGMIDAFLATDGSGAGAPDTFARAEMERSMREGAAVPGMRRWVVHDGDTMIGGASMRIDGGVAQLCGAATLPPHRRRGVQSALLTARLRAAAAAGCDVAVITTQPGTRSQQNAQRQGFALLYARAVLVKTPA